MVAPTSNFQMTWDDVFFQALLKVGGDTANEDFVRASRIAFQRMMASWQNRAPVSWTSTQFSIPLVPGQAVYTLPTDCNSVQDLQLGTASDRTTLPIVQVGRFEYAAIAVKSDQGRPTMVFIDRQRDAVTATFWPVPDAANVYTLNGWYVRKFKDQTNALDTTDVPPRFYDALVDGLAWYMAQLRPEVPLDKRQMLKGEYDESFANAVEGDGDGAAMSLTYDLSCYGRR